MRSRLTDHLRQLIQSALLVCTLVWSGCATYVTPGAGAKLADFGSPEWDIEKALSRKPAASFPARLAMVRVQSPGYRSYQNSSYGTGRYSVVTTRDIEEEKDLDRIRGLPMIAGVAPMSRLLLPEKLDSDLPLRKAAASLQADMLLLYTLDTSFHIDATNLGPLAVVTLGLLPNREAVVRSTASALFYDVRTGFVYGLAESTAQESQRANLWGTQDAIDRTRRAAEKKSFEQLIDELTKTWGAIVKEHAAKVAER